MNWNSRKRWLLAAALFLIFILCFFMDLTGVTLHQWIGLAAGAAALYHLWVHTDWVLAVSARFFGKTSNKARLTYVIDAGLLAGFAAMILSGLLISTWLDLATASTLVAVHIGVSIVSLALVVVKLALHAGWITATSRKVFSRPVPSTPTQQVPASPDRRAFLGVMGAVSVLTLAAAATSLTGLAQAASLAGEETSSTQSSQVSSASAAATSPGCAVKCGRGCSYPGHCRRYTDSNGNGHCDLGECSA